MCVCFFIRKIFGYSMDWRDRIGSSKVSSYGTEVIRLRSTDNRNIVCKQANEYWIVREKICRLDYFYHSLWRKEKKKEISREDLRIRINNKYSSTHCYYNNRRSQAWSGSLVFSLLHPSTFPYFPFFPHSPSSLHYTFNSPQLENAIILPSPPPPAL